MSRLVLALDTATEELAIGLAVWSEDPSAPPEMLGEVGLDTPRASLTHLVPEISRLLASCERDVEDVAAVLVGRGPGSFTGVRIGVAAAKGLAQGLRVPLWGVGTLDAIAERFAEVEGLVGVVGDAMRREVYPVLFRCGRGVVERLEPDRVEAPDRAAHGWAGQGDGLIVLAGNGLAKYQDVFAAALGDRAVLAPHGQWTPSGWGLHAAAWRLHAAGADGDPATVLPVYTRLSDAETAERAKCGMGPGDTPASGVAGPSGGERP